MAESSDEETCVPQNLTLHSTHWKGVKSKFVSKLTNNQMPKIKVISGLKDLETKFLKAAEEGCLEVFEELLAENPELIHTTDSDGYTALHRAAYSNKPEIITACIQNRAVIEAKTSDGWTALHSACHWNSFSCVKLLLQNGANINAKSQGGQTPLHIAANASKCRESLTLLLTHPSIKLDIVNDNNETAYDIAQRKGRLAGLFYLGKKALNEF